MPKIINKFAFLVHEPMLYDHWSDIWRILNNDEFVILLHERFRTNSGGIFERNAQRFLQQITTERFEHVYINDLLQSGDKYSLIISNHVVSGSSFVSEFSITGRVKSFAKRVLNVPCRLFLGKAKFSRKPSQYISLRCGVTPIRIMYGADVSDGWSLADWNEQYRYIFCHGPNDEAAVRSRFDAEVFQMGYPRYDRYFNTPIESKKNPLIPEFSLSLEKRTIVWLPTLGQGVCSIPHFAEHFAKLTEHFNIIVRPHPISFREEPENISLLKQLKFNIDSEDLRDMNHLYSVADFVVCDYGGTSFSALYLDKNIMLLNVPGADSWYTSENSSNMELRRLISPVIDLTDTTNLLDVFENNSIWTRQALQRKTAFQKYFAPQRGTSSARVVELLRRVKRSESTNTDLMH